MDDDKMNILIPMIRNITPTTLAQDIVGVQPMSGFPIPRIMPKYQQSTEYTGHVPDGYLVMDADREISQWIEQQPIYHWKHGYERVAGFWDRYIISEQLYTWLKLRWQA